MFIVICLELSYGQVRTSKSSIHVSFGSKNEYICPSADCNKPCKCTPCRLWAALVQDYFWAISDTWLFGVLIGRIPRWCSNSLPSVSLGDVVNSIIIVLSFVWLPNAFLVRSCWFHSRVKPRRVCPQILPWGFYLLAFLLAIHQLCHRPCHLRLQVLSNNEQHLQCRLQVPPFVFQTSSSPAHRAV